MITISARNVNYALRQGAVLLRQGGVQRDSRNGPVLVCPSPVTTAYALPQERVMLWPSRDANPFFHLVEALWMLMGRKDLAPLTEYVSRMRDYSDDGGVTQPGAYGYRWRHQFDYRKPQVLDQVRWAVRRLLKDPNDRRVVIQMWDPEADAYAADRGGADVPCNLVALPWVGTGGRLCLTVFCRSNDMVWGAYGANAVHFSVLQEWIAWQLGLEVGTYYQVSNNFHAYLSTLGKAAGVWPWPGDSDPYGVQEVAPSPMFRGIVTEDELDDDLEMFFKNPARVGIRSAFLRQVACPMVMAHRAYRTHGGHAGIREAREVLAQMPPSVDWRAAAELWINNREARLRRQEDGGVDYEDNNG